jgi:regulator of replication initiation timing
MNRSELVDELLKVGEKIFSSGSKDSTLQSILEENSTLREENAKLKSRVLELSQENVKLKQLNFDLSQAGKNKVTLDKYVETRVLLEERTKECLDKEKQLEEFRRRESSLNIAGYSGGR